MSEPFLAEIRIVAFNFAPRGWAFCDGQILPINQNQSLYSLLGTVYGGDGRTNFALPDLRGRTPIHVGSSNGTSHGQGARGGAETVTLQVGEIPAHVHELEATNLTANKPTPDDNLLSGSTANVGELYRAFEPGSAVTVNRIANAGGGQAHNNIQPSLVLNFCIALQGLFPSRN